MQLQKDSEQIKAAGIQVVGISYDSAEVLGEFGKKSRISFPLLADPKSQIIKQIGLLNGAAKSGRKLGVAHPMTIVVDKHGVVKAKVSATVRRRHDGDQLIRAVANAMGSKGSSTTPAALNFNVKNIKGEDVALKSYLGKVVVVVNVASKCGYTPQYEPLQGLHKKHKDKGLAVLGFPCNQFGGQEPGSETDIQEFCKSNYGVEFDMFSKLDVKGDKQAPLFKYLTSQDTKPVTSGDVKWNFEKFVIDRNGKVVARFGSRVSPDSEEFTGLLTKLLEAKPVKQ